MNKVSTEERARVVACLVEGNSLRVTTRMTGVHQTTIMKLLADLGKACSEYLIEGRIVSFGVAEAKQASELFNRTGRKRSTRFDCLIAATAICSSAPLATQNRKDFVPFTSAGLRLV